MAQKLKFHEKFSKVVSKIAFAGDENSFLGENEMHHVHQHEKTHQKSPGNLEKAKKVKKWRTLVCGQELLGRQPSSLAFSETHGHWVSAPGRYVRYFFRSVWNRAYLPGTSNRPLPPPALPRIWCQRVATLRGREPWRRAGRACHPSAVNPLLGLASCSSGGPTDRPVEIARVAGLRLTRSHACEHKTQNTSVG